MTSYSSEMTPVVFVAGASGLWSVDGLVAVRGEPLPLATHLDRIEGPVSPPPGDCSWALRGVTSHARYVTGREKAALEAVQAGLGRPEATRAAFIPIRKSPSWWALSQDERRAIFEDTSHHIAVGFEYLPGAARRLYHSRELGEAFDFLTWFEFSEEDVARFDTLLGRLRRPTSGALWSAKWKYACPVSRHVAAQHRGGPDEAGASDGASQVISVLGGQ